MRRGFVYFMRCPPGYLKVGFTSGSPCVRLCSMRRGETNAPDDADLRNTEIIGAFVGTMQDESDWHSILAPFAAKPGRCEWFRESHPLLRQINNNLRLLDLEFTYRSRPRVDPKKVWGLPRRRRLL